MIKTKIAIFKHHIREYKLEYTFGAICIGLGALSLATNDWEELMAAEDEIPTQKIIVEHHYI